MNLNLGIIYKNNQVINHRSFLKILLNPIFRYFGFQIGTPYNHDTDKIGFMTIRKCECTKRMFFKNSWNYNMKEDLKIIKKRRLI